MNWILTNWVAISAAILAVVRVLESIKVLQTNKQVVSILNVIKEILTLR